MTWFQKLYETYGNVIASDLFTDEENALMPVGLPASRHTSSSGLTEKVVFSTRNTSGRRQSSFLPQKNRPAEPADGSLIH